MRAAIVGGTIAIVTLWRRAGSHRRGGGPAGRDSRPLGRW
jgi:hypothetical protein